MASVIVILIGLIILISGIALTFSIVEQQQKASKDSWGLSEYLPESQSQKDSKALGVGLMVFGGIALVFGLWFGGGKKEKEIHVYHEKSNSIENFGGKKSFCVSCGNEISLNNDFCSGCGTKII